MWIRSDESKTREAIESRRRKNRLLLIWAPVGAGILMTLVRLLRGPRYVVYRHPDDLPTALFGGVAAAVIVLLFTFRYVKRQGGAPRRICERCHDLSDWVVGRPTICECGGSLESVDNWEWKKNDAA